MTGVANLKRWKLRLACVFAGVFCMAVSSCGVMIEDNDDCHINIRLTYDMNMKFADAFDSEVHKVTLYAFDQSGNLAFTRTESADNMPGGIMSLDDIKPGVYDLLVWAEGENRYAGSWSWGQPAEGDNAITGLTARINSSDTRGARGSVDNDLTPVFHGMIKAQNLTLKSGTTPSITINLTKDTNVVRIVLQDNSGLIDAKDFSYEITDDNGFLNYDNQALADDIIAYHPWFTHTGEADAEIDGVDKSLTVAVAEMTVGRLFTSKKPRLTIRNKEGEKVLSIPIIDYFLLVKGNYNRDMSDQEYLDRQDEYSITFFLNNGTWVASTVIINSWRVALNNGNLGQ